MADQVNLLAEEDDTIEFGSESDTNTRKRFPHPVAVIFHVLFKAGALLSFLLCNLFSSNFVLNFVVVMMFVVMDFWTTKNVSGRLLVGLRWWNQIDEEGKSKWMFESKQGEQRKRINAGESTIFWAALVVNQVFWIILFFVYILHLMWLVLIVMANLLNGSNLYGYIKCRIGATKSIKDYASNMVSRRMFSSAMSMLSKNSRESERTSENIV